MVTDIGRANEISREEWLKLRQRGVGGSDAASILGINKWKSAFELYIDKIDGSKEINSEIMYWGNVLEDVVAKEFTRRTGKKVRRNNKVLQSREYPWMIANLDREVVGERAVLECKTTSAYNKDAWEDDKIPANYIIQVQHYLAVTGYTKAYIAVLIGGQRFVWKEIPRDETIIDILINEESNFWNNHVLKEIPPAIDGSDSASKYINEKYSQTTDKEVPLSSEYDSKIKEMHLLKEEEKALKTQIKEIENSIKNELQENIYGYTKEYDISWKPITSNRVNSKKLKEEYPETYKKVIKESSYRRLNIKEIKEDK